MASKFRQYAHLSRDWFDGTVPSNLGKDEPNPTKPDAQPQPSSEQPQPAQQASSPASFIAPPKSNPGRGTRKPQEIFANHKSIGLVSAEPSPDNFNPVIKGGHEALKEHLTNMGLSFHETHGKYTNPEQSFIVYNPSVHQMMELGRMFGQESVIHSQDGNHRLIYTTGPKYGKFHAAHPDLESFDEANKPEDFYTAIPGSGYFRMHFNWDRLFDLPQHVRRPDMPQAHDNPHAFNELRPGHPEAQSFTNPNVTQKSEAGTQSFGNKFEDHNSMSDKYISVEDMRKGLAKSMRTKIDSYAKELADLRKKELSKSLDPNAQTAQDPLAPEGAQDPSAFDVQPAGAAQDLCPLCHKEDKPGSCTCIGTVAKAELCKNAECAKNCGLEHANDGKEVVETKKAEDYIDVENEAVPGKRLKQQHKQVGVVPDDKEPKEIDTTEGSGGKVTKTKKAEVPMAKPPSGKIPGGKTPAPVAHNNSKPALAKTGLLGNKMPKDMQALASVHASKAAAGAPATAAPKIKLPGQAEQAQRAQDFSDFMPAGKFSSAPTAPAAFTAPPKPAAPKLAAAPAKPAAKPFGKSEGGFGNCAICAKAEHPGECK